MDLENKIYEIAKKTQSSSENTNELKKQIILDHERIINELNSTFMKTES